MHTRAIIDNLLFLTKTCKTKYPDVQTAERTKRFEFTEVEVNKGREASAFSVSSICHYGFSEEWIQGLLPDAISDN